MVRAHVDQLRLAGLFAFWAGCHAPGAAPRPADAAPVVAPAAPECALPAQALAWSGGEARCGYVLVGGDAPRLSKLLDEQAWDVVLPEVCVEQTCDYQISETELGPLIVAARRAPAGETPSWVGLGIPLEGVYRFVDLWVGESVLDDLTPAGPVHALAPHVCGDSLALLVVSRMGGGEGEMPEPALTAAAGTPRLEGEQIVVDPVTDQDCRRLPLPLP